MTMKSMKVGKKEQSAVEKLYEPEQQDYPYGLTIELDDETLKKLGITELPEIRNKMLLAANIEVRSTSESKNDSGRDHKNVSLQITDMELGPRN